MGCGGESDSGRGIGAIEFEPVPLQSNDELLVCCDGLWEMVRDPKIAEILATHPDPNAACAELIRVANQNGGEDNITAVIVRYV